ncbi:MAG: hypothetical protein R3E10_14825 [Gemmatimonadota bacterium]
MGRVAKIIRGATRMGLTFSAGVAVVASAVGGLAWLIGGGEGGRETLRLILASSIWAFPIGAAFSGILALTSGGRRFEKLSLPRFAALGAAAGLVPFGLLALNAWDTWTAAEAVGNAVIFSLLGGGSAAATLALARRAGPSLNAGDEPDQLGAG